MFPRAATTAVGYKLMVASTKLSGVYGGKQLIWVVKFQIKNEELCTNSLLKLFQLIGLYHVFYIHI